MTRCRQTRSSGGSVSFPFGFAPRVLRSAGGSFACAEHGAFLAVGTTFGAAALDLRGAGSSGAAPLGPGRRQARHYSRPGRRHGDTPLTTNQMPAPARRDDQDAGGRLSGSGAIEPDDAGGQRPATEAAGLTATYSTAGGLQHASGVALTGNITAAAAVGPGPRQPATLSRDELLYRAHRHSSARLIMAQPFLGEIALPLRHRAGRMGEMRASCWRSAPTRSFFAHRHHAAGTATTTFALPTCEVACQSGSARSALSNYALGQKGGGEPHARRGRDTLAHPPSPRHARRYRRAATPPATKHSPVSGVFTIDAGRRTDTQRRRMRHEVGSGGLHESPSEAWAAGRVTRTGSRT